MFVWTINDAIGVALLFLFVIASAIFFCVQALRQRWCKHRQVWATSREEAKKKAQGLRSRAQRKLRTSEKKQGATP